MSDLSPRAQDLLRTAREAERPRVGQKELVRAALAASLPAATAATVATKAGAVAAKTGTTLFIKIIVASIISAGAIGTGVYALSHRPPSGQPPPKPIVAGVAPPTPAVVEPEPVPVPEPVEAEPKPTDAPPKESAHHRVRHEPAHAPTRATPSAPAVVETPAPCSLTDELDLLRQGQTALREGAPQRALQSFELHRQRCSSGTLGEEREAGRIVALCALKRVAEAEQALKQFRLASPKSPQLARLEQALVEAARP